MRTRFALPCFVVLPLCLALSAATSWAAPSSAQAATCARTTDSGAPTAPSPGHPCWVGVTPYPFGDEGDAVDQSDPRCAVQSTGDDSFCHLQVTSLAFRSWNRGIAAARLPTGTTAFGVWLYNGTRWYPDPTFPGSATCPGDTVLWAGKLDYWLVGPSAGSGTAGAWQRVCRYDGANFTWQPLDIPRETSGRLAVNPPTNSPGAIRTATCFAWDNCWLFGDFGAVVHWDGTALTDVSPDLDAQPWLATQYSDAVSGVDASGGPFGFSVGATYGGTAKELRADGTTVAGIGSPTSAIAFKVGAPPPAQPDGESAPQAFASHGGPFSALPFAPPTAPRAGDPRRTDLIAAAFDGEGRGWVAGHPTGFFAPVNITGGRAPDATSPEPSPLTAISPDGAPRGCPGPAPDRFTWLRSSAPNGRAGYLWTGISVFPASGDALAGGAVRPAAAGASRNDDGQLEPVIVRAACDGTVSETRFRIPDPTSTDPAQIAPASRTAAVTAVAANAENDAWAATGLGQLLDPTNPNLQGPKQAPRLYHWTDGLTPDAQPGDDVEARPPVFAPDPPIFVDEDPPPEPPVTPAPVVTAPPPPKPKRITLKPAIYHVGSKTRTTKRGIRLTISFRVRRPVTLGARALRRKVVVASSGLKHFKGTRGSLVLKLTRKHYPTRIEFVSPKAAKTRIAVAKISVRARSAP